MDQDQLSKREKLGVVSGVYIPVCLNIISILMFLRYGLVLGQVGLLGILGLLVVSYCVDFVTTLSLSAIASNGEVKGGGAYYLISRSLGPEFGGSIGILFYLAQVLNTALNVVGLIDCLELEFGSSIPHGYWWGYLYESIALLVCTCLCLAGSNMFARANKGLLVVLVVAIFSVPFSAIVVRPFQDLERGVKFTGLSLATLKSNLLPRQTDGEFHGLSTFRRLFGILFPSTSGIFAGASMSGDLKNPSRSIPSGTLWGLLSTFVAYLVVILSMAASTTHSSFLLDANVLKDISVWPPIILAGECATTFFSALMGMIGAAKLMQALARDRLFPGLAIFGQGTRKADEPIRAIFLTYLVAQLALFADLNQIATFISMGYQMTFFVMNLACFLLKIGSAPNFRPGFKFFTWQSALAGSLLSAIAMFFMQETYAATAVCLLISLFLLIHYLSPPKHWGDVSQNLIYHQVRKYLLRLKAEHIKFWRPQIILLINDPRRQTRLIQFCNSMKKGALYILGHVILTDDFSAGVVEARLQQAAWTRYISEYSRIKAFVQLSMSPSITWGVRNLILSAGLGGMKPNIAVLGFYNMNELRVAKTAVQIPEAPLSPSKRRDSPEFGQARPRRNHRRDSSAQLMEGYLPTDTIKTEDLMSATDYMTVLEDLALRFRLNVAIAKGFQSLETPSRDDSNTKKYIDLWPIQMSAELAADGKNVLTSNFDTYTLILQLGYVLHSVQTWGQAFHLRVLVFVEYEDEVEESRARVQALLEKLRIEAEILVSWLSCGQLSTYETIVQGRKTDLETEELVSNCLKDDDWWQAVKRSTASLQEPLSEALEAFFTPTATGPVPNRTAPRAGMLDREENGRRRESSVAQLTDLPKHPTVSQVVRLGVSMNIRSQNFPARVFEDVGSESSDAVASESESSEEGDFNDEDSAASEGDLDNLRPTKHQLLSRIQRRKSYGDALRTSSRSSVKRDEGKSKMQSGSNAWQAYGTMSPEYPSTVTRPRYDSSARERHPWAVRPSGVLSARSASPTSSATRAPPSLPRSVTPSSTQVDTPSLPRQRSAILKFSSHVVPETKITHGDETSGPRIMFADSDPLLPQAGRSGRPALSRNSSSARLGTVEKTEGVKGSRTGSVVSFAGEQPRVGQVTALSPDDAGEVRIDIPDLLARSGHGTQEDYSIASENSGEDQALSFNDIPSRAQHLILNELMRKNSSDTVVLFTTLPIPEERTCESEQASLQYLSDVEVLCNDLPPVLLVLSNNMTVTVSI